MLNGEKVILTTKKVNVATSLFLLFRSFTLIKNTKMKIHKPFPFKDTTFLTKQHAVVTVVEAKLSTNRNEF